MRRIGKTATSNLYLPTRSIIMFIIQYNMVNMAFHVRVFVSIWQVFFECHFIALADRQYRLLMPHMHIYLVKS